MSKRKGFQLNVGFITGVFAVCAISIATGYFLKNSSISASTTAGSAALTALEYSNASALLGSTLWSNVFGSDERNRSCAASTGLASKEELPLTDSEKEKYGDTAKAYFVKINGKISEFRLVMSASRVPNVNDSSPSDGKQTDVMIEYALTYLNDPRVPNAESRGGYGDNITVIYNNAGFVKTYNTLVKNDPWDDFVKAKGAYTYFEQTGSKDFNVSVHFKGKHNDGCINGIDLKDALIASVAPTPSVTPSATASSASSTTSSLTPVPTATSTGNNSNLTVSFAQSAVDPSKPKTIKLTANVTDTNTVFANTNYTFWWNCPVSIATNSTYETIKTACGEPVIAGADMTDQSNIDKNKKGRRFVDAFVSGENGKMLQNTLAPSSNYPEGGQATAIVLVERRGLALSQQLAFTIGNGSTPTVTPVPGYDYAGDEALNMTLRSEPTEGKLPLTVNATATLGGTNTGDVHWRMYCGNTLPNLETGIVEPSKEITDLSTSQTLSCTYKTKRSFRLFVIAERGGDKVVTKTWIRAGFIPLNDNQEKVSIDLKKGFNVFGSELVGTALKFQASGGLTVFRFNYGDYKKWLRWPEQKVNYNLQPGKGYYLYSPKDQKVNVVMRKDGNSIDERKLFPGWNMVWAKDEHDGLDGILARISMSDSKNPLNKGINKCVVENQDLQELVDKGVAYKYVYIIKNGNATEACDTFQLLETGSVGSGCDKINAAKTVTTTSTCSACSLDITDKLPAGSVFWIYIYESKLKQVDDLASASATVQANMSVTNETSSAIHLSGQRCN